MLVISDTIPFHTTYVPGSMQIGPAGSTYGSGTTVLPDTVTGGVVMFTINDVAAGADGKVYFKVKVD